MSIINTLLLGIAAFMTPMLPQLDLLGVINAAIPVKSYTLKKL